MTKEKLVIRKEVKIRKTKSRNWVGGIVCVRSTELKKLIGKQAVVEVYLK